MSESIPEGMRTLMIEHHRWREKRLTAEMDAMLDRSRRARKYETQL